MNKEVYCSAMDHLEGQSDGMQTLLARIETGEKPRLSVLKRIPPSLRKAAEFAAAAACLAILSLFIFPLFQSNQIKLPNSSSNVTARVVKNPELNGQSFRQPAGLSEEDIFQRADTVLSGTVEKMETLEIVLGKDVSYRSLITVSTDNVWRGTVFAGSAVQILLPCAIDENSSSSNSQSVLSQIRTGMHGIFLMESFTQDSRYTSGDQYLSLIDLAPYGLSDDASAFIEKNGSIVYRTESFPGLIANPTWDEVCGYIAGMMDKQPTTAVDNTTITGPSATSDANTTNGSATTSDTKNTTTAGSGANSTTTAIRPVKYSGPPADDFDFVYDNNGNYYRIAKDGTKVLFNLPKPSSALQSGGVYANGEWVYYVLWVPGQSSEEDGIYRCRPDGSESTMLCKFTGTFSLTFTDNAIIIKSDFQHLYSMNKDGSNLRKLCDLPADGVYTPYFLNNNFTSNNQYAYVFEGKSDYTYLLQISLSDGSYSPIHEWKTTEWLNRSLAKAEDGWIYYLENYSYDNKFVGTIKRIRMNGTEDTVLRTGDRTIGNMQVFNGKIYFQYTGEGNALYQMPVDASSQPQLINMPNIDFTVYTIRNVYIQSNHIYIECSAGGAALHTFRMNPDGSGAVQVN